MSLDNFEKYTIITVMIIGLVGGVALVYFQQPAFVSSLFLALGVSTIVYHFLGGIQTSEFNMGPIKLGGSIAALMASAWIINGQLENQTVKGDISINSKFELFDSKNNFLGKLAIDKDKIGLNKNFELQLNDSITLGNLNFSGLKLIEDFQITALDSLKLGKVNSTDFQKLGLFTDFEVTEHTELKYDLQLSPSFKSSLDETYWDEKSSELNLKATYVDLPFEIKPVYKDEVMRTQVKVKKDASISYEKLDRGFYHIICPGETPSLYIIRAATLVKNKKPKTSFDNFVVYQIYGYSRTLKDKSAPEPY